MSNFSQFHTSFIFDFWEVRRYFLSVELFTIPHFVYFRLLRSSSIFSKCRTFHNSTLRLFRLLRSSSIFSKCQTFHNSTLRLFSTFEKFVYFWLLRSSLIFSKCRTFPFIFDFWEVRRYFLSVELFTIPHFVFFEFWEIRRYFLSVELFTIPTLRLFSTFEKFVDIFQVSNFSQFHTSFIFDFWEFRRYFLSVELFTIPHFVYFRLLRSSSIFSKCRTFTIPHFVYFQFFEKFGLSTFLLYHVICDVVIELLIE